MMRQFRDLDPAQDRDALRDLLTEAQDYYWLWLNHAPTEAEVDDVFQACPPGCDPQRSRRLGLFLNDRLSGVAELSFGFPTTDDAYLGLMILAPRSRNQGHGEAFTQHILDLARQASAGERIYLAVLEKNPKGRAFWSRQGFKPTGVTRSFHENGVDHRAERLVRSLGQRRLG